MSKTNGHDEPAPLTGTIDEVMARLSQLPTQAPGPTVIDEELFRRRRRDAFFPSRALSWWKLRSEKLGRPACEENCPGEHPLWNKAWQSLREALFEGSRGPVLLLTGRTRTGKTVLATGLGLLMIRRGKKVSYNTWFRVGLDFEEAMRPNSERCRMDVLDGLCLPTLLILDEISAGIDSEANARLFRQVITEREGACKPTILISNHCLREITRFLPETVISRIEHSDAVIDFDWNRLDQAAPGLP